jgi:hypothetical protein
VLISTACVVTKPIGEASPIDLPRALIGAIVLGIVVSAVGALAALCVWRWLDAGEPRKCPMRDVLVAIAAAQANKAQGVNVPRDVEPREVQP